MRARIRKTIAAAMTVLVLAAPVWGTGCTRTADDNTIKRQAEDRPATPSIQSKDGNMQAAINEALVGISYREGGPFGAAIVKDRQVIGSGHARTLAEDDPTLHGEMAAIKEASQSLDTTDLTGCVMYTTCEPCAMCLAACRLAHIEKVYYGCTLKDAHNLGFPDLELDDEFGGREQFQDYLVNIDRDACLELYATYKKSNPNAGRQVTTQ